MKTITSWLFLLVFALDDAGQSLAILQFDVIREVIGVQRRIRRHDVFPHRLIVAVNQVRQIRSEVDVARKRVIPVRIHRDELELVAIGNFARKFRAQERPRLAVDYEPGAAVAEVPAAATQIGGVDQRGAVVIQSGDEGVVAAAAGVSPLQGTRRGEVGRTGVQPASPYFRELQRGRRSAVA